LWKDGCGSCPAEGQDVEGRNISDLIAIGFKARRSPTKCLTA
jgi:hypothetical protein